MKQQHEIDGQHVINSLASQLAKKGIEAAQMEATVIALEEKISSLEEELKVYREKEIEELDNAK